MRRLICLLLALSALAVYWQVHGFDFVNYDDPDYVTENSMVKAGLSLRGVLWAFTHFYASNWHPLTWISHMLDCQLFGLNAGGPHVVNVLFHAANSILLFLLLHQLTRALWRSAIVAAIFALHPLHVESVAWISERKDVLSVFFALLSLLAYSRHAALQKAVPANSKPILGWPFAWFALGLLAKPMLVTLPFVLLLLDFWPLQRIQLFAPAMRPPLARLVKEKWPWFLLAAASCALTLLAQSDAAASAARFPLRWRIFNAIESYFWYLQKTFWPNKLAVFYPMEYVRPMGPFVIACACLAAITAIALLRRKRSPYLLMGWLWFVGTLVPVIGLVQVGSQSTADRYSYFPMIGILIAGVWFAYELLSKSRLALALGGVTAGAAIIALACASFLQVAFWKNSVTLFGHAVAVTHDNDTALNNLGVAFYDLNRNQDAGKMFELALQVNPHSADVHKNVGLVLDRIGKPDDALAQYLEAVRLQPGSADLQNFLAETLTKRGDKAAALPHYTEAVRLNPDNAQYHNDLAVALVAAGQKEEALAHYKKAVSLDPANAHYQNNYATALARAGDANGAFQHYNAAIKDDPKFAEAHSNLAGLLAMHQQPADALEQYSIAMDLNPTNATIRFNMALLLVKMNRASAAVAQFIEAARLRPDWAEPLNTAAWLLATSENDQVRDGPSAVKLAEQAAQLTSRQQPAILNTLAAAYAEAGRFDDAVTTAREAVSVAQGKGMGALADRIQQTIALYQARTPLRAKGLAL